MRNFLHNIPLLSSSPTLRETSSNIFILSSSYLLLLAKNPMGIKNKDPKLDLPSLFNPLHSPSHTLSPLIASQPDSRGGGWPMACTPLVGDGVGNPEVNTLPFFVWVGGALEGMLVMG